MLSVPPSLSLLLLPAPQDVAVRLLVMTRLRALGALAPGRDRMTAARGAAFAAAMRMVDRIHRHAAHRGPLAEPAVAAGLADVDVLLVGIGDCADRRHALAANLADLARGQPQQRVVGVAADQLDVVARGAGDLAAAARLHLDVVDHGAD